MGISESQDMQQLNADDQELCPLIHIFVLHPAQSGLICPFFFFFAVCGVLDFLSSM